ncbi:unnamed protein product [Cutaneotrichosporon oleaginosum]
MISRTLHLAAFTGSSSDPEYSKDGEDPRTALASRPEFGTASGIFFGRRPSVPSNILRFKTFNRQTPPAPSWLSLLTAFGCSRPLSYLIHALSHSASKSIDHSITRQRADPTAQDRAPERGATVAAEGVPRDFRGRRGHRARPQEESEQRLFLRVGDALGALRGRTTHVSVRWAVHQTKHHSRHFLPCLPCLPNAFFCTAKVLALPQRSYQSPTSSVLLVSTPSPPLSRHPGSH